MSALPNLRDDEEHPISRYVRRARADGRAPSELDAARAYFIRQYLNTGCDEEEAAEHADNLGFTQPDQFYGEACRYEDM